MSYFRSNVTYCCLNNLSLQFLYNCAGVTLLCLTFIAVIHAERERERERERACVRACVYARARVCACARVCVWFFLKLNIVSHLKVQYQCCSETKYSRCSSGIAICFFFVMLRVCCKIYLLECSPLY